MAEIESKISTELNLALSLNYDERNKSIDLNVGFNAYDDTWELIIKYIGNITDISKRYSFTYVELLENFAIIIVKTDTISQLIGDRDIVYIDKPKKIVDQQNILTGYSASCFDSTFYPNMENLAGQGVLVAVIDSGIDYKHEIFNNDENRIFQIWDQNISGLPPEGYNIGTLYEKEDIQNALEENRELETKDFSGHGTAIASIITRIAPKAELLIVKLLYVEGTTISKTSSLIMGIDYAIRTAINYKMPLVVNLSFGNNYGDHNSDSIIENYLDSVSNITKLSIIVGAGNEGVAGKHSQLMLGNTTWLRSEFIVAEFNRSINLQVWRNYIDIIDIFLITPSGREIGPFNDYQNIMNYNVDNMYIAVINGFPTPYNQNNETYISIIPINDYIEAGVWEIRILPKSISNGRVDIWLPVETGTEALVRFLNPSEFTTLTIPSTASSVVTVGAYDEKTLSYASFSGRGYTVDNMIKPDIVAPGVDIETASVGGGYELKTGTSFATPFVAGAAALMMEYGIIDGNDPFLFGEKLKSYLIRGAKTLPGISKWPNEFAGWGALCFEDSLPE